MAKYHINNSGDAGPCRAQAGKCPFGGEADHYETAAEARAAFEKQMGGGFGAKDSTPATDSNAARSELRADLVKALERDPRGTGSTFFSTVRSADDYLPEDIDAIAEAQLKPLKRVAAETRTMNKICAKYGVTQADFEEWAAAHPALPKMVFGDREIHFHPSRHLWVHGLVENGGRTPDKSAGYNDKTGAEVAEWVAKGRPMPTSEQSEARAEKGREHFRGWGRKKAADPANSGKPSSSPKELDPAMIEALKLKYLKRFKVPFDESGLSVGELLQMAQRGELG